MTEEEDFKNKCGQFILKKLDENERKDLNKFGQWIFRIKDGMSVWFWSAFRFIYGSVFLGLVLFGVFDQMVHSDRSDVRLFAFLLLFLALVVSCIGALIKEFKNDD